MFDVFAQKRLKQLIGYQNSWQQIFFFKLINRLIVATLLPLLQGKHFNV